MKKNCQRTNIFSSRCKLACTTVVTLRGEEWQAGEEWWAGEHRPGSGEPGDQGQDVSWRQGSVMG